MCMNSYKYIVLVFFRYLHFRYLSRAHIARHSCSRAYSRFGPIYFSTRSNTTKGWPFLSLRLKRRRRLSKRSSSFRKGELCIYKRDGFGCSNFSSSFFPTKKAPRLFLLFLLLLLLLRLFLQRFHLRHFLLHQFVFLVTEKASKVSR